MAEESSSNGTDLVQFNCDSSESTIAINIKTLDSQTYSLPVNKNMPVPALKEKIVAAVGVPLEQQRLIYRGKVLKDDQLLSDHHLEDGDTLHLVVRQPVQAQPASLTGAADASRTSSSQANDSGLGRGRVGQITHSVLLGTVNVADGHGEVMLPEFGQIMEVVRNALGVASLGQTGGPTHAPSVSAASSGAGVERPQNTSRTQAGNSAREFLLRNHPVQSSLQFPQLPIGTLNQPLAIPDALTTLSGFIDRMEVMMQSNNSLLNGGQHQPRSETASLDARGLPTPEYLSSVMDRVHQLLRENATAALSNVSSRLHREGSSSDPVLRGQIQTEAMQLGVAMHHMGAMLLELGRAIMTLRMGQSPAEACVNAGPAVYVSPSGPNPIMVQPFPLQSSPLFGISSPPLVTGFLGRAAPGDPSSNINIHIHAGSSVAQGVSSTGSITAEATHGEHLNAEQRRTDMHASNDSSSRGVPSGTVVAAAPSRPVPETTGHVLNVIYPVQVRSQQYMPIHSAPQVSVSTLSRVAEPQEQNLVPPPTSISDSIPTLVDQITARIANAFNGDAQVQSSSNSMPCSAIQTSHTAASSSTPSNMSSSSLQATQMNSTIKQMAQSNVQSSSALLNDAQAQKPLSKLQSSEGSSIREDNEVACLEDQLSGHDGAKGYSENVLGAEDTKQGDCRKNHASDLTLSRKEIQLDGDQISIIDSNKSSEESSTTSSTNGPVGIPPSSSIISSEREPDSVVPSSSNSVLESDMLTPLGLGFGGLQPKKRSKPIKPRGKDAGQPKAPSSDQNQHSLARGNEVFRTLASQTSPGHSENTNEVSSLVPSVVSQFMNSVRLGGQEGSGQTDFSGMIANTMQSSAFSNLLSGVASQSGVSPDDMRSMLEQCVRSPTIQNTVNQLVQQVGQNREQGNILGTGQDRLDFTGMIQQMLPAVSQALGRTSTRSAPVEEMHSEPQHESNDVRICAIESLQDSTDQVDLGQALERIEQHGDPRSIFEAMLEIAGRLHGEESSFRDFLELGNNEELANEFIEVLRHDIRCRLEKESSAKDKS